MRTEKPRPGRLAGMLALALVTGACETGEQPRAEAGESPRVGGTVVIAAPNDLAGMNSLTAAERYTSEWLRYALFLPLIRYDDELAYAPALAESFEVDGDTAVVFRLRRDVRWHDGARTTANDVVFTFERAKNPETGFPNDYFQRWTHATALDSFTVRFGFEPHADPLAGLPYTPIMPRHLLDSIPAGRMKNAEFNRSPVGNGPFRYVSHRLNDRWIFEANDAFPEPLGGRPNLDRVVWRVVPENDARVAEIRTGTADVIFSVRADQLDALDADPQLEATSVPSRRYVFIGWNGRRPPLGDPAVRRALAMALDREAMLRHMRGGHGEVATSPVSSGHWAYDPDLSPLPFDTVQAARLLDEAGLRDRDGDGWRERPDGRPLAIELKIPARSNYNRDLAELIRAQLQRVGVRVNPRPVDFSTLIGDISGPERRFEAVLMSLESDIRLDLGEVFHSQAMEGPFQLAGYRNPEVDTLLDRLAVTPDREQARPAWHRLQAILREEQPWTFLYFEPDFVVRNERVRAAEMDVRGLLVNLPEWWVTASRDTAAAVPAPASPDSVVAGG